jgi:hypothetical protein
MWTKHTSKAYRHTTSLTLRLAPFVWMDFAFWKREFYFALCERNDVMSQILELLHVCPNTVHTQIGLTTVTKFLSGVITKVTVDDILCPGGGRSHSLYSSMNCKKKSIRYLENISLSDTLINVICFHHVREIFHPICVNTSCSNACRL